MRQTLLRLIWPTITITGISISITGCSSIDWFDWIKDKWINNNNEWSNHDLKRAEIKRSYPLGDTKQIYIQSRSAKVQVHPTHDNQIEAYLSGETSNKRAVDLISNQQNGKFTLKVNEELFKFSTKLPNLTLDLYIPQKKYDSFTIESYREIFINQKIDSKKCNLESDLGDITLSGFQGNQLSITTKKSDIKLGDITGEVRIKNDIGSIEINNWKNPAGNSSIKNKFGRVNVLFEKDPTSLYVDLASEFGKIKTDYVLSEMTRKNNLLKDRELKGYIGSTTNGSPKLSITTSTGDITINSKQ